MFRTEEGVTDIVETRPIPEDKIKRSKEPDFIITGIKKNVFVLGLVSLFTDIASEMLYPVIPIFLTAVLGAPMVVVGLIEGVAEGTASFLKVITGWYSDRIGRRKPFVLSGYSISTISKPLIAFAYTWPLVLVARFMDRFGKGVRTSARDALIADSCEPCQRGRSYGFHRALDTVGAVIGPAIAILILYLTNNDYRLLFLVAFVPGLIGVLLVMFFVSERKNMIDTKISFKVSQFGRDFKVFLLITSIFALGNSSDVFLILRAQDLGFSISTVLLCYILYNVIFAIGAFPAGILSDKMGRRDLMTYGFLIFACVYAGFALTSETIYVWMLFVVYGLYAALTDGIGRAYVVDLVPFDKRATALGIYHTAIGIMMLFANLIAGILWDVIGAPAPFIYGAIAAVVSALMLILLMPMRTKLIEEKMF